MKLLLMIYREARTLSKLPE
ncbi:hypothetical protein CGSHiII_01625 [Haemophilus influenzae PittII]|nr:hypothetical protein CGSHiII_01625 [Haemophilus influenzae PittII]